LRGSFKKWEMEDKGGMYWGLFIHEIRSMSLRDGFLVFSVGNFFFFDFTNNMLSIDEGCFISFHFILFFVCFQ